MDNRLSAGDGESYWEKSRRVRESWARHRLADVLFWAFGSVDGVELVDVPDDELENFRYGLAGTIRAIEPAWAPVAERLRHQPVKTTRAELRDAFAKIRTIAHAITTLRPTAMIPMTVGLYALDPSSDLDGRPRWNLHARLSDALVWGALKLFSEVPRSLIRQCAFGDCSRIYVAAKNQKYCAPHHTEAIRLTQRRAEHAFRKRQRAARTKGKRKK